MSKEYEINPFTSLEILVWARMGRKGVHGQAAMKKVMDQIEGLYRRGGSKEDMIDLLKELGEEAAIK